MIKYVQKFWGKSNFRLVFQERKDEKKSLQTEKKFLVFLDVCLILQFLLGISNTEDQSITYFPFTCILARRYQITEWTQKIKFFNNLTYVRQFISLLLSKNKNKSLRHAEWTNVSHFIYIYRFTIRNHSKAKV